MKVYVVGRMTPHGMGVGPVLSTLEAAKEAADNRAEWTEFPFLTQADGTTSDGDRSWVSEMSNTSGWRIMEREVDTIKGAA